MKKMKMKNCEVVYDVIAVNVVWTASVTLLPLRLTADIRCALLQQ